MTPENEFKEALADMSKTETMDFLGTHFETIRRALLIAGKLMQEPTLDMLVAGGVTPFDLGVDQEAIIANLFKDMRDAMLAELDKGE